jgi:hypothetical protein
MSIGLAKMAKISFGIFIQYKLIIYQLKITIIVYFPKRMDFFYFLGYIGPMRYLIWIKFLIGLINLLLNLKIHVMNILKIWQHNNCFFKMLNMV